MINNDDLSSLLKRNEIKEPVFEEKLYNTLILGVFEAICKDINKKGLKTEEKERFRKASDKTIATKRLVSKYIGCSLSDTEYSIIAKYLTAFFSKASFRKSFDNDYKIEMLQHQKHRCKICNTNIDLSNSHLDHIIPFNYVGDELSNNYQMLCETCNTRKGSSMYFEISMLLLNRK